MPRSTNHLLAADPSRLSGLCNYFCLCHSEINDIGDVLLCLVWSPLRQIRKVRYVFTSGYGFGSVFIVFLDEARLDSNLGELLACTNV